MLKTSGLTARRDGFTRPQFADYMVRVHAPLSRNVTQVAGYAVTAFGDPLPGADLMPSPPDGMAEFWFRDDEARAAMASAPEAAAWLADSPKFVGRMSSFTEEVLAEPAFRVGLEDAALAAVFVPEGEGDGRGRLHRLAAALAAAPHLVAHAASELSATTRSAIGALDIPPLAGVAWLWAEDEPQLADLFGMLRAVLGGPLHAVHARQTLIRDPYA